MIIFYAYCVAMIALIIGDVYVLYKIYKKRNIYDNYKYEISTRIIFLIFWIVIFVVIIFSDIIDVLKSRI